MVGGLGFALIHGSTVRGSRMQGSLRAIRSLVVLGSLALAGHAGAQEPTTAAPNNYRLELDNEFVRVIRATLAPRDHVPVHQHPTLPTVYVYLTDAGPTRFTHITPSYTLERAPVRAGGVRY